MRSRARLLLALGAAAVCLELSGCERGDAGVRSTLVARPSPGLPWAPSAPASAPTVVFSDVDHASFDRLQATLPGPAGVALSGMGPGQPVTALGSFRSGIAWSTSKVPVVMAAMAAGTARASDVHLALRASANEAAIRIWRTLGSPERAGRAATAQVRAAGDGETVIQSRVLAPGYTPFGQTEWSLAAQARFMAGLPCAPEGLRTLAEMRHVIPAQRWGLGTIDPHAAFKGGWGPGTLPGARGPWLERQMGLVVVAGKPVALAVAVQAPGGDHTAATAALSQLAVWVTAHADTSVLPSGPTC